MDYGGEQSGASTAEEDGAELLHLQAIIPRLYIGDYHASQSQDILTEHSIAYVVSAMKQTYPSRAGIEVLNVPVDDTDKTNIIEWFDRTSDWIQERLQREPERSVLVHCMAGVSRSTTIVAAYLMRERGLSVEDAINLISLKRPQVNPTEFFLGQLEMYASCDYTWDPAIHPVQRRFLMGFVADQMRDGEGATKLILAWYPSPAPSPRDRSGSDPFKNLAMTPLMGANNGGRPLEPEPDTSAPPVRQRLTKRTAPRPDVPKASAPRSTEIEKLGQGRVTISGRRIRCKMCRRELAARQHVLYHEAGHGHAGGSGANLDASARREHTLARLSSQSDGVPSAASDSQTSGGAVTDGREGPSSSTKRRLPNLANLRVSMPPRPPYNPQDCVEATQEDGDAVPAPTGTPPLQDRPPSPPLLPSTTCTSYFLEAMSWMAPQLQTGALAGKLVCPKKSCSAKLGYFDWSGLPCSCGTWITPGFSLQGSKVDEVAM